MDPADDDQDPRCSELEILEAIYPEIRRLSPHDAGDGGLEESSKDSREASFVFELELPVEPAAPVTVAFPAAESSQQPQQQQQQRQQPLMTNGRSIPGTSADTAAPVVLVVEDSLQVSHLPPLSLRITLPPGYPTLNPPQISISTTPSWLGPETLSRLQDDGPRLWEEAGRDLVAYAYVDHVQRAADDVFGAITDAGTLQMDPEHKLAVLDYDIKAKRAAFERETFDCGICLDPKKGSQCHKMVDCGHIFCLQCLQDFYDDAIQDGNLSTVRCLTPNCAKERAASAKMDSSRPSRKPKTFISPSELLQIGLSEDAVKRYVTLKYKTELESDKNTIYCPRQWCTGAARSKKHKKPSGLEFAEVSDAESDSGDGDEDGQPAAAGGKKKKKKPKVQFSRADLLAVCEDCSLAFCSKCYQSWHGEFVLCTPKRENGELTEEEKASLEYLRLHTSACPTCNAMAQKSHGCNHMICSRCDSHFCYLCSSWLDPGNPYRHYNTQQDGKVTSCYMRLWELEGGDGNDIGIGFVGGQRPAVAAAGGLPQQVEAEHELVGDMDLDDSEESDSDTEDGDGNPPLEQQNAPQVAVAREAPLVLRLIDNEGRRGRGGPRQVAQAAAPRAQGAGGRGRGQNAAARGAGRDGMAPRGGVAGRGARGRGARGRGRGGRGGGGDAGDQRQQVNNPGPQVQGQVQVQAPAQALVQQPARVPGQQQAQDQRQRQAPQVPNGDGLDAEQEAWVRRFVQMALIDEEDQVEGDSDEDDDNWMIR